MTYREQLNKVNELGISICDLEVANELDATSITPKRNSKVYARLALEFISKPKR